MSSQLITNLPFHQASTVLTVHITAPMIFALATLRLLDDLSVVTSAAAHGVAVLGADRCGVTLPAKRVDDIDIIRKHSPRVVCVIISAHLPTVP